ncbi:MAG TPA: bifunctional helix-turn-helix transcriptional regulator/GNAT family N-acetyltransferase [Acetobacteraceae bacterium]|nr:bifunctional helix-turn-helix transcriptional regulator/GNAT family N-acetyltransferase [Acetobacteraceae bacterium]
MSDILRDQGHLFLGSRLKRLGERMQGDVARIVADAGLAIQPAQYPILATLDLHGAQPVGEIVRVTGVSQPAVTRSLGRLQELGLVEAGRAAGDQRQRIVSLTAAGRVAMARSKAAVWPLVEAAVVDVCAGLSGSLLEQLGAIEDALVTRPLHARGAALGGLTIVAFSDDLAAAFHDINAQWISSMFTLEATDREVLEAPRARIIDPGGDILFVAAAGLGIVGTCALQKTGEKQFELTKMGVLERARGRKAGEFLLRAVLRRAAELDAERLYLLTNSACGPAIHLYEKLGFVHDAGIMREFGARYRRCDVAMLYRPGSA